MKGIPRFYKSSYVLSDPWRGGYPDLSDENQKASTLQECFLNMLNVTLPPRRWYE